VQFKTFLVRKTTITPHRSENTLGSVEL